MRTLADRAADVFARHPSPALSLEELRRRVRGSGIAVGEDALLRALTVGGDRFRVLDPWRGPWAASRAGVRPGPRRAGRAAPDSRPSKSGPHRPGRRWVVAAPGTDGDVGDRGALRRLRRGLLHLGWRVDARSPRDTARWCRLAAEAGRVRAAVVEARRPA